MVGARHWRTRAVSMIMNNRSNQIKKMYMNLLFKYDYFVL